MSPNPELEYERLQSAALIAERALDELAETARPSEFAKLSAALTQANRRVAHARGPAEAALLARLAAEETAQRATRQQKAQAAVAQKLKELNDLGAERQALTAEARRIAEARTVADVRHSQILGELNHLQKEAAAAVAA